MTDEIELVPDAARTIEGLRDTGYDFLTAVADIVDNSIAASATQVVIRTQVDYDRQIRVSISDNGIGMTRDDLVNAMKYGSKVRANKASLGKFGLGLKTASTAMCRRLVVVSRSTSPHPTAASWDLDYVASQNKWLLTFPEVTKDYLRLLDESAEGGPGTVVIWEKVDRLLSARAAKTMSTQRAVKALERQVERLREHLGVTYVRFLRGDAGLPPVAITVDGVPVEGWDPFAQSISEKALDESLGVGGEKNGQEIQSGFQLRGWLLPPAGELTPSQLSDLRLSPERQGFYVFRENRLISAGDWLGMYTKEMHQNLARFDLSFDHSLDDALQIDIKKSRVRMPPEIEDEVKRLVAPVRREADDRYRANQRTQITRRAPRIHETADRLIDRHHDSQTHVLMDGPTPEYAQERTVNIDNRKGSFRITATVMPKAEGGGAHVVVVDSIAEGFLWKPAVVDGRKAVLLNASHPFYSRVYTNLQWYPISVQAIDFILWSLAEAEWASVARDNDKEVTALRSEASRTLRRLAEELPLADVDDVPMQ